MSPGDAPHREPGWLAAWGGGEDRSALPPGEDCIPAEERARVDRILRDWFAQHSISQGQAPLGAPLYPFYPMGGRLYRDIFTQNFMDLSIGTPILDWDCGDRTYNGHKGSDTDIRSFGEQAIGVPIFSVLDGTVVTAQDGFPDMNTSCSGQSANYVIVDHGSGRLGYYWHMKTNSVAVTSGQAVVAGQELGLVGSSGCSTGPHLHFESRQDGPAFEPYTGLCNPGPSGWAQQTPIDYSMYMSDFGVSYDSPGGFIPPAAMPRSGQWPQTNNKVYFWGFWKNFPAFSTYRIVFRRPSGAVEFDSGTQPFNNPAYARSAWWWWGYQLPKMKMITGTWQVQVEVNGILQIDAPIEVVPTLVPGFNRAPEPISISLEPVCADPSDVLRCSVETDLALDDLDWDIVRYHYLWKVNGNVVRDVVSAGQMDALPRNSWIIGDVVTCEVTPGDGSLAGPTASTSLAGVTAYCTAKTSSILCLPTMSSVGAPSVGNLSPFLVEASGAMNNMNGILFYGYAPNNAAFQGGTLCVAPPVLRTPIQNSGGNPGFGTDCSGAYGMDFNAYIASGVDPMLTAGQQVHAQYWGRDPGDAFGSSLSNGLQFVICN